MICSLTCKVPSVDSKGFLRSTHRGCFFKEFSTLSSSSFCRSDLERPTEKNEGTNRLSLPVIDLTTEPCSFSTCGRSERPDKDELNSVINLTNR